MVVGNFLTENGVFLAVNNKIISSGGGGSFLVGCTHPIPRLNLSPHAGKFFGLWGVEGRGQYFAQDSPSGLTKPIKRITTPIRGKSAAGAKYGAFCGGMEVVRN